MPDRLVQQHAAAARPDHDRHLARRRLRRAQLGRRDARRLARDLLGGVHVVHFEPAPSAVAEIPVLALPPVARDDLHPERDQRPPVGDDAPVARGDLHVLQLVADERVDRHDARVERPRRGIRARQQIDVPPRLGRLVRMRVVQRRRRPPRQLNRNVLLAPVPSDQRSGLRRPQERRLVEIVGVRVPCPLPGDDPHARAAKDARRSFLDLPVLEPERLRQPVLEEHVGEVAAAPQRARQDASEHRRVKSSQHNPVPIPPAKSWPLRMNRLSQMYDAHNRHPPPPPCSARPGPPPPPRINCEPRYRARDRCRSRPVRHPRAGRSR